MTFTLPKLNYAYDALEPVIDSKTMEIHHTKHHQAYIDKLNVALEKYPELQGKRVEELLADLNAIPEDIRTAVRNNGGGHYNHSFFWEILSPKNQEDFVGEVSEALRKSFSELNSFDELKKKFEEIAMNRFGSGWAWFVVNKEKNIEIVSTANQDCPISEGKIPIIGLDLWEHAYYIKHMWNRKAYVQNFWKVINWEKVNELYLDAMK